MQIRKAVYRSLAFYILFIVTLSANAQQGHKEHIVAKGFRLLSTYVTSINRSKTNSSSPQFFSQRYKKITTKPTL